MKEFDKILWGFIFSAGGIAFGWTLNQLGQWFRTIQEDKRSLKIVLYNLLEIYFVFSKSNIDKFVHKITSKVHSTLPQNEQKQETWNAIHALYSEVISNYFKPELLTDISTLQENYQNSIKTLASIDPLTAYYLSGRTKFFQTFDLIENVFGDLKEHFPNDPDIFQHEANQALKIIKPDIFKDTLYELGKDIKSVAWKINPCVWIQSMRAINRLEATTNKTLDDEVDKIFDKLKHLLNKSQ